MNCETCAFWIAVPHRGGGKCCRYAPRPDAPKGDTQWPRTAPEDWCGEWEEKRN